MHIYYDRSVPLTDEMFCSSVTELDNMYVHLTNVSVQKHGVS